MDDGATISVIDAKLAKTVGLRGEKVKVNVVGIRGHEFSLNNCEKVNVEVIGTFGKRIISGAVTSSNVKMPVQTISSQLIKKINFPSANIQPYNNAQVQLLIGQDNWKLLHAEKIIPVQEGNLALSRLPLGWAIHGPEPVQKSAPSDIFFLREEPTQTDIQNNEDCRLDALIREYFDREAIGVNIIGVPRSKHDRAKQILEATSKFCGTHWETGLLWNANKAPKVNSYATAFHRLQLLEKRMDKDSDYANLYRAEMKRFIEMGYAVKIDPKKRAERVWYLPHFGVTNVNKPNKVRLVFDAAAKTSGISFNDQLDSGPDLLQSLPGVLIRFRQYPVALTGDIKDMFLRVKIMESDRGAQRFLWRENNICKPDVYEMNSLIFGSKSSPCSALFIKNKNAETFKIRGSDAHKTIVRNSYMDDFLTSCREESEAAVLIKNVERINSIAGFFMHAWSSNCASILPKNTDGGIKNLCDNDSERVLGLVWNTVEDTLKFNVAFKRIKTEILNGVTNPTKREVLRVVMSVYDPLGLLAPFSLKAKLLLQQIWRSGVKWDAQIRDDEKPKWAAWLEELKGLGNFSVARCVSITDFLLDRVQLHVFCDASLEAYSAVAYLRFEKLDGEKHVAIIMAKNRIAPLKPTTTIPRLELQAALLGSRLAKYIKEECDFKISQTFLWSDSKVALSWIRSEPRVRTPYVSYRLGEIAELTSLIEWHWVPGDLNPADDATRFTSESLHLKDRWLSGPSFLYLREEKWPKEFSLSASEKEKIDNDEIRKTYIGLMQINETNCLPFVVKILGWSGLLVFARRLINIIEKWKKRERIINKVEIKQKCENYWYRRIQRESFGEELENLGKGKKIEEDSKILSFNPYIDANGILRASGRVNCETLADFDDPIILYAKHFATRELIREYHRRYKHGSNNTILNEMRQKYLIIGLRKELLSLASHCLTCRLQRAKPFQPIMADLPLSRLAFKERPFTFCGLDYFGPFFVKIGRRREKRWGALFTCLTTRAVHIEIAHSLSSDSVIMILKQMASIRGRPKVIHCDNGTNFHGAVTELKEAVRDIDYEIIKESEVQGDIIKWKFNPPDAPHMGGAWERLIRSVKTSLHVVLKEQAPSEEVLRTIFSETAHSINSRPLTHVSLDLRDQEALTPNHFLIGSSSGEVNTGRYNVSDKCPKKQWKAAQYFADMIWKRWLREYLPTLLPRQKWTREEIEPIKIGDVVLIIDLQAPRNVWRRGVVTEVYPGKDGQVRVAKVKTPTGEYTRPTRKLIKLLINDNGAK